ncbi:MAG TPA: hypothetical protein VJS64_14435, partial [Pyrinomonadaceae bacterium]|nr:hypothetical protein [Pyrinomonadaceae bacterium]
MKKIISASCLLIVIALLFSVRWGTKAVNAPPQDTLATPDTTLAVALSLQEMATQSDAIVIGSCLDTRSVWVDRTLVTLATVSVSETLKGTASTNLTVVLPGGVDANRQFPVAVSYPGAPRLTPGEDVFLFLTSDSDAGGYIVSGFSQGKFSIVQNEGGEPMVSRDLTKMSLKGNKGVRRGSENATPLSSFKAQVRAYLS